MALSERQKRQIAGAVAEVDDAQIAIWRKMPPARRAQLALSMIRAGERVGTYRLRLRRPELSQAEALFLIRKAPFEWERVRHMADETEIFDDFLRTVIDAIEEAEIDYLIGGAVGAWAWGGTRTTADFDVVLDLPTDRIVALSESLGKRNFLVPPDVLLDLLIAPGDLPANANHMTTGLKAEFFLLRPGDELRASALQRRMLADLGPPLGVVYVHSPEDLILYKTIYYSLSQQTKHISDISIIVKSNSDTLEMDYIRRWVARLGLEEIWQDVWAQIDK
ncbi:MAG: hypothetical protein WBO46_15180 [Caldilineaceae bacterium]